MVIIRTTLLVTLTDSPLERLRRPFPALRQFSARRLLQPNTRRRAVRHLRLLPLLYREFPESFLQVFRSLAAIVRPLPFRLFTQAAASLRLSHQVPRTVRTGLARTMQASRECKTTRTSRTRAKKQKTISLICPSKIKRIRLKKTIMRPEWYRRLRRAWIQQSRRQWKVKSRGATDLSHRKRLSLFAWAASTQRTRRKPKMATNRCFDWDLLATCANVSLPAQKWWTVSAALLPEILSISL